MHKAVLSGILSRDSMSWMIILSESYVLIHILVEFVVFSVYHKHLFISNANIEGHV
jgi:hypothetical protein